MIAGPSRAVIVEPNAFMNEVAPYIEDLKIARYKLRRISKLGAD
jgi:hypothetical protein